MDKKNKLIFIVGLFLLMMFSSGVNAMKIEQISDYQTYKPVGWNVYTGVQVDASTAGVHFELWQSHNTTPVIDFQSPDGTTSQWYVWIRLINSTANASMYSNEAPPHDINFHIQCTSTIGNFIVTANQTNSTWNSDYEIFRLTYDTEGLSPVVVQDNTFPPVDATRFSPTGKPLYAVNSPCQFSVDDASLLPADTLDVYVWNVNPSRESLCNIDPAVSSLQETTVGLISINYQIWQILFDLFSIVIIIVAIFGLPILMFKMVHWIIEEIKKVTGGRKIF